ncbi:MAG: sugar ABC transporter ATP-binding protein [Proteobacteria bacterium]|nr:sugar ABC transporter ATP-binding protein [Pseudomonadota bacterium]
MLLETRGLGKSFGVVAALSDVSFSLRAGEVHGLMGENGAGKSTLIKLLTGFHPPSAGEILLDGTPVSFDSPRAAQAAGVAAVYQEINLIPERSVAANIFLAREPRQFGLLTNTRKMEADAAAILSRYGLAIDPRQPLRTLGLGLQQMVSIARVVSLGARVVIMDEPTSALAGAEVDILYGVVEQLRREGRGIVYVSHRLSECYRLCDRLTVLRDGRMVESATTADLPRARLVAAMLGRESTAGSAPGARPAAAATDAAAAAPIALSVRGLSWRTRVRDVSIAVRRGEILGLAGLLGAGRTETFKAIYGAETPDRGDVEIEGRRLFHARPAASIRRGLAFLSEDRRSEGIFPKLSVRANLTAAVLPRISRFGVVSRRRQTELVNRYIRELGIKTAGPEALISELSGGNQQKVLIARALCTEPRVVMLDDPTRGIDVGAKAEVHRTIRDLARKGLGVVVTSSEVEEVLELSDRLVVLNEGAIAGELETAGREPEDVLALLAAAEAPRA